MTKYVYHCPTCGEIEHTEPRTNIGCRCGREAKRSWRGISISKPAWKESHFNHQVGKFVRSESELKDELKKISEQQSSKLGMDVQTGSIDVRDGTAISERFGITKEMRDEDLEATKKHNVGLGKKTTSLLV